MRPVTVFPSGGKSTGPHNDSTWEESGMPLLGPLTPIPLTFKVFSLDLWSLIQAADKL